ncbi:hypothetical protein BHE74_00022975 [Ensete ventricosum]|nr:hypothetical protein GW17_00010364 [Ensete ventricosum]RWW69426.1 hypothetical protein BHE74_00022975 [Ensete ventricosum]RZR96849.1 hypothetical protein BHM03_00025929 [Ensete ventricosum]
MGNLDTRGIEDGVLAGLHGEKADIVVDDATEGADDLGGGLQAPEKRGNEDAVDGDAGAAQPLPGGPRPDQAPLGERRVPRPLRVCHPQRLLVVDPVPMPHHPHVLHPYLSSPILHCSLSVSLSRSLFKEGQLPRTLDTEERTVGSVRFGPLTGSVRFVNEMTMTTDRHKTVERVMWYGF